MYVCLLDLTKAFDLVKHNTLFLKLCDKLPPLFLRLIIISYICQSCCIAIRWNNVESNYFNVSNGVRQGAVASPKYFNVYTDELFSLIKDAGLGCYIDSFYYGVLGYADDFALLSPSRDGLQQMVNICQTYFTSLGIKISVNVNLAKSKTKYLAFNVTSTPKMLSLYNMSLPWVPSHIHLGKMNLSLKFTPCDRKLVSNIQMFSCFWYKLIFRVCMDQIYGTCSVFGQIKCISLGIPAYALVFIYRLLRIAIFYTISVKFPISVHL